MGAAAAEGGDFIAICQRILTRLFIQLEENKELRAVMELSLFKAEHTEELAGMLANQRASMNELVAQLAGIMQAGIAQGALQPISIPGTWRAGSWPTSKASSTSG